MRTSCIAEWVLDLLFPKICAGCGNEGDFCCASCRETLHSLPPGCPVCAKRNFTGILCDPCQDRLGLRRFFAPFSYRDPLARTLIHTYKYEGARELAGFFADALAGFLARYGIAPPSGALLVPIPLHRKRERERGFNQADLLARKLGERWGLPVARVLSRVRATESQVGLASHEERRRNVEDAFAILDPPAVSGTPIILVDDVSTSGATLSEAARLLRAAGARTVWAVAIAKG